MYTPLIELTQQEQRKDLLREMEQERLIKAAGLRPAGLGSFFGQVVSHLNARIETFLISNQSSAAVTCANC